MIRRHESDVRIWRVIASVAFTYRQDTCHNGRFHSIQAVGDRPKTAVFLPKILVEMGEESCRRWISLSYSLQVNGVHTGFFVEILFS
jgi:hypothetical protein